MFRSRVVMVFSWTVVVVTCLAVDGSGLRGEEKEKAIEVKAAEVAELYATDPAGYDKKYKDKTIEVVGKVENPKVTDSLSSKEYVTMPGYAKKGERVQTIVRCELTKELAGLKAGDEVTIRGKCKGHSATVAAVELTDCVKVKKK